jgi:uncharacterized protein YaeQ
MANVEKLKHHEVMQVVMTHHTNGTQKRTTLTLIATSFWYEKSLVMTRGGY